MRQVRTLFLVALLLPIAGTSLNAQAVPRRGLWIGGGLGFGFARVRCDVCTNDRDGGISGHARLGGSISPSFLLGVEGNGWRNSEEDFDFGFGAVNAVGYWYPSPTGAPWYLKAGFGVVGYRIDDNAGDDPAITATSFGGQFGAGYDLRIAGNLSLTPYFTFIGSLFADLEADGEQLADATLTLIHFGLGLTFH
jgi:hypothetical protein